MASSNPIFWRFDSAPVISTGQRGALLGPTDKVVVFTALGDCGLQTLAQLSLGMAPAVTRATLAGNVVLTAALANGSYRFYDPNGSDRTVTLWATPTVGDTIVVKNIGSANVLNIVDAAAGALATVGITDLAALMWDGTVWELV